MAPPQLAVKSMQGLTEAISKVVLSTSKAAHQHARSADSLDAADGGTPGGGAADDANAPRVEVEDCYGFTLSLTPSQAAARAQCAEREERRRAKWEAALAALPEGGLPPEELLKRLCRKGVPPDLRGRIWPEVSGAAARRAARHASYYAAMAQLGKHESPFVHQIDLDVPRTFPTNAWVQSEAGQSALRHVLVAFSQHWPAVGYCQGMNYVAALALCALGRDEEAAFWLLDALIVSDDADEGILYPDMYARDLTGTHVEMRSLRELVGAKLPRLGARLDALGCDMSLLATDWFLCLFATTLPPESAARAWDALLCEGPKVLFRLALALLRLHEPALLAADSAGELLRGARAAAAEMHDRDSLMKVAFEGVGSLPMGTIRRHRQRKQREVDAELAARETRAALRTAVAQGFVLSVPEDELLAEHEAPAVPSPERKSGGWRQLQAQVAALGERTRERLDRGLAAGKQRVMHRRAQSMG